ncbi:MAG: GNAT family N-acetyltransferase [Clostridia bacterium]|nr:GNAT family N-acetyltransferase [Clostridia bacterium]MBR1686661.1 GNAT family N-acetyltransferase [Clostridia bacterium]MBR2286654.1 GNAT family N-acetyltransferase [Clostridia bacterium]
MIIREMRAEDYDRVYALWMSTPNMGFNDVDDSRAGIEKFLRRNPGLCFIAQREEDGQVLGVVLAGEDGRRGYIYHMAVAAAVRRQGIGTLLTNRCLKAFEERSITKVALLVFCRNEAGNAFWEKQGFVLREDIAYRNRELVRLTRIDT